LVSAATAPEISTDRPSGRHSHSSRLTRLTAGLMAVTSSRSASDIAPRYLAEMQSCAEAQRRSPCAAAQRAGLNPGGTVPAELGLEQSGQHL